MKINKMLVFVLKNMLILFEIDFFTYKSRQKMSRINPKTTHFEAIDLHLKKWNAIICES